MTSSEAWRQTIAKAELLLSEGEADEDIPGIADAVSAFNSTERRPGKTIIRVRP